MDFSALYVHIPFCERKCNYCDFVSYPWRDQRDWLLKYGDLLLQELRYWQNRADLASLETLYLGGGTPTLLPDLPRLVSAMIGAVGLSSGAEVTAECNPGTVDRAGLYALRAAGVNRLSIGLQSLIDDELKSMGRIHDAAAGRKAVRDAKAAGFTNINIDLIYGLPGQTMAGWQKTLRDALELDTQHISFYGLTLADQTPWGRALLAGELTLPDEDLAAKMMERGGEILRQGGFCHYEIANFAKPGHQSRHNSAYWQRQNYLGLGVAASSCCGDHRFTNPGELSLYAAALEAGKPQAGEDEYLSREEVLAEAMFLGLRLLDGLDLAAFAARYGIEAEEYFAPEIARLVGLGLLEKIAAKLKLTKKGLLLANEVFMSFLP